MPPTKPLSLLKGKPLLLSAAAVLTMLFLPAAARADSVTFVFNAAGIVQNNASTPLTGNLTLTISDVADTNAAAGGTGTQNVMFTITNNTNGDAQLMRFNYNGGLAGQSAIISISGAVPSINGVGNDIQNDVPGTTPYDLTFGFGSQFGPHAQTTSIFIFDMSMALSASSFSGAQLAFLVNLDCAGQTGNTNCGTVRVAGTQVAATTPEPATMILLGSGLAGVVGAVRRRRMAAKGEEA